MPIFRPVTLRVSSTAVVEHRVVTAIRPRPLLLPSLLTSGSLQFQMVKSMLIAILPLTRELLKNALG